MCRCVDTLSGQCVGVSLDADRQDYWRVSPRYCLDVSSLDLRIPCGRLVDGWKI